MTQTTTKPRAAKPSANMRSVKTPRTRSIGKAAKEAASPDLPNMAKAEVAPRPSKIEQVVAMLKRDGGATSADLMAATGWQAHSVRGAIAGTIKKKLGLSVVSAPSDLGRVYSIAGEQTA